MRAPVKHCLMNVCDALLQPADESAEHAMLREAVSAAASRFGHQFFVEQSASRGAPDPLWDTLAASGFVGANIDGRYGGGGGGLTELCIIQEELAAAGLPSMIMVVSGGLCVPIINEFGTSKQRDRWLPGLAEGARMAFALTESDAGSNSRAITTTAVRSAVGWRLRGQKVYTSGLDQAKDVLIVARTRANDDDEWGLSMFVVPVDTEGLVYSELPTAVQTPEGQYLVQLDDVEVEECALLGREGAGLRQLFVGLTSERIIAAALCNGLSRYCLSKAITYAKERSVWGQPIGAHQSVAHPLAEAAIDLQASRLMTQHAARTYDAAEDAGFSGDAAKHLAARTVERCFDVAIQTHGGNGLSLEYGLADLWGLVRLYTIAPVSKEMVLSSVAHRVLGLPRSF
jgi:alkylation response protein AidB-like acyl-CoA dehydrogenase